MDVFRNRPRSMVEILQAGAGRFGDRPYLIFPERQLTFESILQPVAAVADSFRTKFGIGKGDRVAIASANRLEYVLAFWAATSLGAVTVALNGWWTGPEMAYALELTEPKLLLGDSRRLERLEGSIRGACPSSASRTTSPGWRRPAPDAALPEVAIDEDDPYVILFTSGTTGRPKGAVISHRSNIHFGLATQLRAAESIAEVDRRRRRDARLLRPVLHLGGPHVPRRRPDLHRGAGPAQRSDHGVPAPRPVVRGNAPAAHPGAPGHHVDPGAHPAVAAARLAGAGRATTCRRFAPSAGGAPCGHPSCSSGSSRRSPGPGRASPSGTA